MSKPIDLTIAEASAQLRRRQISAVELTAATLQRIEDTEPVTHAYVLVLAEHARRAAYQVDREIAQGCWRGSLHGIPVGVKDICYMQDLPTEAGSRSMAGFIPGYDATVVRRLQDAGAIIIGKTTSHEFAYGVNVPPTRSPWCLECYPGGSSTGSGVAVTVRSAFGAIGTDTGGSIRIPASINGIVGLKPTYGRVSRYGVVGLATSLDHVGPMTRTIEDCAIFLQAIAGYDHADPGSINVPVPDYRADLNGGVRGLVVGIERDHFFYEGVAPGVRRAVEQVIAWLSEQGATIVEVKLPELSYAAETLMTILAAEASTLHRKRLREQPGDYDPSTRLAIELGEFVPATHYLTAQRARTLIKHAMANLFKAYGLDAILSPTMPVTTGPDETLRAPRADYPGESAILSIIHHSFNANVIGQPALSVPCGLSDNGLPVGFQLLGRPFDEATLFRLAHAYERAHTWTTLQPEI